MSSPDYGTLQILIDSRDPAATTLGAFPQYTTFLSGSYRLKLINAQINSSTTSPSLRPVQIAIEGMGNFFGVQYPTFLYPIQTADFLGIFEIEFSAQLQSKIGIQIREITGAPMTDFTYAVLTFKYERV